MKVLYIDGVGPFGGSSRSLYEMLAKISNDDVQKYFITAKGTSLDFYSKVCEDIITTRGLTKFDHTRYGYYRKQRWLILLREIFYIPFTFVSIFKAKRRWKTFDIVHINEITDIVSGVISSWVFGCPLIVHVRAVVKKSNGGIRDRFLSYLLKKSKFIVAIDSNVKSSLPRMSNVNVINNSFSVNVDSFPKDSSFQEKINLIKSEDSVCFGFVGNLHISKGVFEILEAISILRKKGYRLQFFFVGGSTAQPKNLVSFFLRKFGLAQNIKDEAENKVLSEGINDSVFFLGPTYNIDIAYKNFDVLCFPSHFNAPGRPVFEAAAHSVPSIVAVTNPQQDTLIHNSTGIAIDSNSKELANAMAFYIDNPDLIKSMGKKANELYKKNNLPENNAKKMLKLYNLAVRNNVVD